MHHVFVSYSRSDSYWVTQLVPRLEARGIPMWIDQRDIPVTLPWMDEIQDAIAESDLFLICDSINSQSSQACAVEKSIAVRSGKRQCQVTVGSDLAAVEEHVADALLQVGLSRYRRTELVVLSRDWDRAAGHAAGWSLPESGSG